AGDYVQFSFDTPGPYSSSYRLLFRYANGGNSERPMVLRLDDSDVIYGVSFQPTGSWTRWETLGIDVSVNPGHHAARLTAVGSSGPNLDAMSLGTPVFVDDFDAARALFKGPTFSRQHRGYYGTGYADYVNDSGDYLEWIT